MTREGEKEDKYLREALEIAHKGTEKEGKTGEFVINTNEKGGFIAIDPNAQEDADEKKGV